MRHGQLAATVLALVLAAGCASNEPSADPSPAPVAGLSPVVGEPIVQDHDHTDPTLHNASHGLRLVAHVKPWGDGSAYGVGTVNELAVNGNHVFVSRSNPEGGFAIVDLSDPRAPEVVGDFRSEGGGDVEVTSDGLYALLATQRTLPGQQTTDNATNRAPRGVYVVDVADKAAPTLSSFLPLPTNGPHTIHYWRVSPQLEIVTLQTYDLLTTYGVPVDQVLPVTQRIYLTQLVRTDQGARLEPLGVYQVPALPQQDALVFPHDAFIERHPLTEQLLMYVAYWDGGLRVVDLADPTMPQEIASFLDFTPSALVQMHDARTFPALFNGTQHVTAVGPEIVTAPEAGQITFLNTTDPADPQKLGWWSIPGNLTVDQPFLFSPHVFDTNAQGMLVIGHNHGGVWLIDASDPTNATSVGFYQPHEVREGFSGVQPSVWGARFLGGYIVATDGPTGLYVLETENGPLVGASPGRAGS